MKKIEITTTQNVTIEYKIASVFERVAAFILDNIILYIVFLTLSLALNPIFGSFEFFNPGFIYLFMLLVYPIVCELYMNGQTFGKKAVKIRVMKITGEKLTAFDCILRGLFRIIDTIGTIGALAVIGIVSSKRGQRLGGALSDTVVVKSDEKKRFPLEHVLSLQKKMGHEPVYKGVKKIDEQHMLLLKEVVNLYEREKSDANKKALLALTKKMENLLDVKAPKNKIEFLKTLLNDYVVLTR